LKAEVEHGINGVTTATANTNHFDTGKTVWLMVQYKIRHRKVLLQERNNRSGKSIVNRNRNSSVENNHGANKPGEINLKLPRDRHSHANSVKYFVR
jgi:hypothetical protein